MNVIKLSAWISTLSITGFLVGWFLQVPFIFLSFVFVLASAASVILLSRCYILFSKIGPLQSSLAKLAMRAHVLLHIVPFSYFISEIFFQSMSPMDSFYLAPVLLFFLTGRETWKILSSRFTTLMYKLFYKGNTGMLISLPVLFVFEVLFSETASGETFQRVMSFYFTTHFLIIGAALVQIEKDFNGAGY